MDKYRILPTIEKGVLVGFSGGPDSVMLISLLYWHRELSKGEYSIAASHVHHMIRGESADRDLLFAKNFSSELGIECFSDKVDVPRLAEENGLGIEEMARNARYSAFDRILLGRKDIFCVALAHNSTDNMETVMLNMLRGSGPLGMCGIPPVRENIIRPLLSVSKDEIHFLLDKFEIPYVIDESNLEDDYSRNYVRNKISPLFSRLTPRPADAVFRMSESLRCAFDFIDSSARDVLCRISDPFCFKRTIISNLHHAVLSRVLVLLCERVCGKTPEEKHIGFLLKEIGKDDFSVSVPGGYDFICERGMCSFRPRAQATNNVNTRLFLGTNKIDGVALTVFVGNAPHISSSNIYKKSIKVRIPSAIIDDGLFLRFRRDGDAYHYGGMTHKLKKVFNDRGIPPFMRDAIPVICDNEGIIFVPGLALNDRIRVDGDSITLNLCFGGGEDGDITAYTAEYL